MKNENAGKTTNLYILALLVLIVAPVACSIIGGICPDGPIRSGEHGNSANGSETYAGAYGAFRICDADGRAFDVCAACRLRKDGSADLYLVQRDAEYDWLTAGGKEPDSLEIADARWFVCDEGGDAGAFLQKIPVRAVYMRTGTLQTVGTGNAPARLIWAES